MLTGRLLPNGPGLTLSPQSARGKPFGTCHKPGVRVAFGKGQPLRDTQLALQGILVTGKPATRSEAT